MRTFDLSSLVAASKERSQAWQEFLRVPSLSMGLYCLKAGQPDEQKPHTEDEVYFVISGKAWFGAGEQQQVVDSGTVIFVERTVAHRSWRSAGHGRLPCRRGGGLTRRHGIQDHNQAGLKDRSRPVPLPPPRQ
jgi:hypothetical protein